MCNIYSVHTQAASPRRSSSLLWPICLARFHIHHRHHYRNCRVHFHCHQTPQVPIIMQLPSFLSLLRSNFNRLLLEKSTTWSRQWTGIRTGRSATASSGWVPGSLMEDWGRTLLIPSHFHRHPHHQHHHYYLVQGDDGRNTTADPPDHYQHRAKTQTRRFSINFWKVLNSFWTVIRLLHLYPVNEFQMQNMPTNQ